MKFMGFCVEVSTHATKNNDMNQQKNSHKRTHSDTQGVVLCRGRIPFDSEQPLARNYFVCVFLYPSHCLQSPGS